MANQAQQSNQLSLEVAVARFKQGQCPCCGKGVGESRGLEYRPKSEDLYCHSCRRPWPSQMDLIYLEEQIALILSHQQTALELTALAEPEDSSAESSETPEPALRDSVPALAKVRSGFGSLLGVVLKRH
ncbi:MAG: hypothetical protein ACE5Q6_20430 [Dehalococcoidia bacterium]